MAGKFEIYKDKKGEFRFRLKATNGQVMLSGEAYSSGSACKKGVESVQRNSADPARFERKEGKNGKHYFVLKSRNSQVIGQSQMYDSEASMEAGIKSVMKNGSTATVEQPDA